MKHFQALSMSLVLAMSMSGLAIQANAQQRPLKEQIVGTWSLVAYDAVGTDGSRKPFLSAQPKGIFMVDGAGRYSLVLTNPERPKKWSGGNREAVPAEDYKSAAMGLIAQFGSWSVDEGSKTFTRKVEGALNPTLAGVEQKLSITLAGDELKMVEATSGVTGTRVETAYRRVK
jgi:hypothetical protein